MFAEFIESLPFRAARATPYYKLFFNCYFSRCTSYFYIKGRTGVSEKQWVMLLLSAISQEAILNRARKGRFQYICNAAICDLKQRTLRLIVCGILAEQIMKCYWTTWNIDRVKSNSWLILFWRVYIVIKNCILKIFNLHKIKFANAILEV